VTGFLGAWVARELLDHGYRVRGTARDAARAKAIPSIASWLANGDALEIVQADLIDPDHWDAAVEGCELVAHVASPFFLHCSDEEAESRLFRPARDGTRNVLRAAADAGTVKRVVVTSSLAAILSGHEAKPMLDHPEEQWANLEKADNYAKSKALGERAAWDLVDERRAEGKPVFELVVLNPSLIIGPPLTNGSATSHMIPRRLLAREIVLIPDLHFGVVDVRDVARAHRLALENPDAPDNRFALQSHSVSLIFWSRLLAKTFKPLGFNPPTRKLPKAMLLVLSFVDKEAKPMRHLVGKGPFNVSTHKVKTFLNLDFTPYEATILEHAHGCLQVGIEGFHKTPEYRAFEQSGNSSLAMRYTH